MKPGDLVRQAPCGMPRYDKVVGIVLSVREHVNPSIPCSILVFWGPGHHMNNRWVSSMSMDVVHTIEP